MRGQAIVAPGGRFLRFEFEPKATVADWKEARTLLMEMVQKTGIRNVLVDLSRQKASGAWHELFSFGVEVPDGMAFAVLADLGREDYQFVETVALNRGKAVRLFAASEEPAAVAWLEAQAKP